MATNTILLDVGGTFIKGADGRQTPIASGGSRDDIASALRAALKMPGQAGHDGSVTPDTIGGQAWHDGSVTPDPIGGQAGHDERDPMTTVTPDPIGGLQGIGVAIPGPFDYEHGIFLMRHKCAAVYGERFRDLAGVPENIPVKFMHDVNAPLAGAIKMLGLENCNTALITLGTGLGFSYSIKGEVQYGPGASPARSLWNMPLAGGGILEDKISARGILAAYTRKTGDSDMSVLAIAQRAFALEPAAKDVFTELGETLGDALKDIFAELQIDTLLMGGQISKSLELMIEPLQNRLPSVRILPLPEGAVFEGLATLFDNNVTK